MSRKSNRLAALLVALFAASGCAYPTTTTIQSEERPALAFPDAPAGAMVFLDGIRIGSAERYNGESAVLVVEPGRHVVRLADGEKILFEGEIFLSTGETREIRATTRE